MHRLFGIVLLAGLLVSPAWAQKHKGDRGIILDGEQKLKYIGKQLKLNPNQQTHFDSLLPVYTEMMKDESDQAFLIQRLTEIQGLLNQREEAKKAGDDAKAKALTEEIHRVTPGVAPERQFFENLAEVLTAEQKTTLEAVRAKVTANPDVSLTPTDVLQIAKDQKLSKEQEAKLDKQMTEFRDEMALKRPNNLADRLQRVDQLIGKVRGILTPEQQTAFDAEIERKRPPVPANLEPPSSGPVVTPIRGNFVPLANPSETLQELKEGEQGVPHVPASQPASKPANKP